MARQNRRAGDIDFLTVQEGGTGQVDLSAFRTNNNFIAKNDPRVISTSDSVNAGIEVVVNGINDVSVIKPDLIGPEFVSPGESVQYIIANRDLEIAYSVETNDGTIQQVDGTIIFNVSGSVGNHSTVSFKVNGYDFTANVIVVGPVSGVVLASSLFKDDQVELKVKATEFYSNTGTFFKELEYHVATDFDFEHIIDKVKTPNMENITNVEFAENLYIRARYIDSNGNVSAWFYTNTAVSKDAPNIAKPQIAGAVVSDGLNIYSKLKGSPFISKVNRKLLDVEVALYTDKDKTQKLVAEIIRRDGTDLDVAMISADTNFYATVRYVDDSGSKSEWSDMIALDISRMLTLIPTVDVGTVLSPYTTVVNYGRFFNISKDGSVLVAGDSLATNAGIANIYTRVKNRWTLKQQLTFIPSVSHYTNFGAVCTMSDDGKTIFVTATKANANQSGAVFVTKLNEATGQWEIKSRIDDVDNNTIGNFGYGIVCSADGNKLIIFNTQSGDVIAGRTRGKPRFHYYELVGATWTLKQSVDIGAVSTTVNNTGLNAKANAAFTRMVFNADADSAGGLSGSVQHYTFNGTNWVLKQTILPANNAKNFGRAPTFTDDESMLVLTGEFLETNGLVGGFNVYNLLANGTYDTVEGSYHANRTLAAPAGTKTISHIAMIEPAGRYIASASYLNDKFAGQVDIYIRKDKNWKLVDTIYSSDRADNMRFGNFIAIDSANAELAVSEFQNRKMIHVFKTPNINYMRLTTDSNMLKPPVNISSGYKLGNGTASTITATGFSSRTNSLLKESVIEISADASFANIIYSDKVNGNVFNYTSDDSNIKYVRTKFVDNNGNTSKWSDVYPLDVSGYLAGVGAPVISVTGSRSGINTNFIYTYPEPTIIAGVTVSSVELQVSDTDTFKTFTSGKVSFSDAIKSLTIKSKYNSYYFRARFVTSDGLTSEWSNIPTITEQSFKPSTPVITHSGYFVGPNYESTVTATGLNIGKDSPLKTLYVEFSTSATFATIDKTVTSYGTPVDAEWNTKAIRYTRAKFIDVNDDESAWSNVITLDDTTYVKLIDSPVYSMISSGTANRLNTTLTFEVPVMDVSITSYTATLEFSADDKFTTVETFTSAVSSNKLTVVLTKGYSTIYARVKYNVRNGKSTNFSSVMTTVPVIVTISPPVLFETGRYNDLGIRVSVDHDGFYSPSGTTLKNFEVQISKDYNFATIADTIKSPTGPVSIVAPYLERHYMRGRFVDSVDIPSEWSEIRSIDYDKLQYSNSSSTAKVGDNVGRSIAVDSTANRVFVGAYNSSDNGAGSGCVYVLVKSGNKWNQEAKIIPADNAAGDNFGYSLDITDDSSRAVITAPNALVDGKRNGATYFYRRIGTSWSIETKVNDLTPPDTGLILHGYSASIAGNGSRAVVGAKDYNGTNNNSGCIFVYYRTGSSWDLEAKLFANVQNLSANFGEVVKITKDGIRILVGAPGENFDTNIKVAGCVYVFRRNGTDWIQENKVFADDKASNVRFGTHIATTNDSTRMVVGAPWENSIASRAGAAYVFTRNTSTQAWTQEAKILPFDGVSNNEFGTSVAINTDGDMLLVGCPKDDVGALDTGSVYSYIRYGTDWVINKKTTKSLAGNSDWFGISVAMTQRGNTAFIGSAFGLGSSTGTGSSNIVELIDPVKVTQANKFFPMSGADNGKLGMSVAISDNEQCFIAGAPAALNGGKAVGSVQVYSKFDNVWQPEAKLTPTDVSKALAFGTVVKIDETGTRIAIGAPKTEAASVNAGAVYIFLKTATGWQQEAKLFDADGIGNDGFGEQISIDKTCSRVVIGSCRDADLGTDAGTAFIYKRTGTTWALEVKLNAPDGVANDQFGTAVAISREGTSLAVSSPYANAPGLKSGAIYIYYLYNGTWYLETRQTVNNGSMNTVLGTSLMFARSGSRLVATATGDGLGYINRSAVFVFDRRRTSWFQTGRITSFDRNPGEIIYNAVTLSKDGTRLAIAAKYDAVRGNNAGAIYTFTDNNGTWIQESKITADDGGRNGELFGTSIAISGGANIIVAGSPNDIDAGANAGAVYLNDRSIARTSYLRDKILPVTGFTNGEFGASVSSNGIGDKVLVGSPGANEVGAKSGAAYIFSKTATGFTQEIKFVPKDAAAGHLFGTSVSFSANGETAVVSAPNAVNGTANTGAAYVFYKNGKVWEQKAKLVSADGLANDSFGMSVAISKDGTRIVVGAPGDSDNGLNAGTAFVFNFNGTEWVQEAKLLPTAFGANNQFGHSVSIDSSGMTVAVSSVYGNGGAIGTGAAYIYRRSDARATTWLPGIKIQATDSTNVYMFGKSVCLSGIGDRLFVGSGDSSQGQNSGAVYSYMTADHIGWTFEAKHTYRDVITDDNFGSAISVNNDGTVIAVGSTGDTGCARNTGAAYILKFISGTWTRAVRVSGSDGESGDKFGNSVALNDNGSDLFISAPTDNDRLKSSGSVYHYKDHGAALSLANSVSVFTNSLDKGSSNEEFAYKYAVSSDGKRVAVSNSIFNSQSTLYLYSKVNGIWKLEDILVSPPGANNMFGNCLVFDYTGTRLYTTSYAPVLSNNGKGPETVYDAAYIAVRDPSGTWSIESVISHDTAGGTISRGYSKDAVLSSDGTILFVGYTDNNINKIDVHTRAGSVWTKTGTITGSGLSGVTGFGHSMSISKDGTRAVIGAPNATGRMAGTGAVYVYFNNAGTWTEEAKLISATGIQNHSFGFSVSINDNGSIIGIGCPGENINSGVQGCGYIFNRSGTTWSQSAKIAPSYTRDTGSFSLRAGSQVTISQDGKSMGLGGRTIMSKIGTIWIDDLTVNPDFYVYDFNSLAAMSGNMDTFIFKSPHIYSDDYRNYICIYDVPSISKF